VVVVALVDVVAETWAGTPRSREDTRRRRRVLLGTAGQVEARSFFLFILCMLSVLSTLWDLDEKGLMLKMEAA